jgi:hypothetical protein
MKKTKKPYTSKTLWFAVIIAVLSTLQGLVFAVPLSPLDQAVLGILLSVIVALLRIVTSQPLYDEK